MNFASGGQFAPDRGGQFRPVKGGQFAPESGGQFDRILLLPGRTKGGVRKRRKTLGIERTPEEVAAIMESNKPRFLKHSFKPGRPSGFNNRKKASETRRLKDYSDSFLFNEIQRKYT